MTIKAALLDEQGIYLRIDELADVSLLTERHLPQIMRCDLPPGEYKWISDDNPTNPYGGYFESVAWRASVEATRLKAIEDALPKRRRGRGA